MFLRRRPWAGLLLVGAVVLASLVVTPPAAAAGMVTVVVQGQGGVWGDGISCTHTGGDCTQYYPNDEDCTDDVPPVCIPVAPEKELTAGSDANGFAFAGFQNCDEVVDRTCRIVVGTHRTVTAVFADVAAPSVSIAAPSGVVAGSVPLSATAADNSGVDRVEFRVRGVLVGTDAAPPYELAWDSTSTSDGSAAVSATAVDRAGLSSSSTGAFTIDNTAPVLDVDGPDGGTYGPSATLTWNLTAADTTSGVSSVACAVAPAGVTPSLGPCTGGTVHQATGLADGSHVLTVRASDAVGNATTVTRSVRVDATAPQTSLTKKPRSVIRTTKRKVTVRFGFASTEPGSTFRCRLDGGAWKDCPGNGRFKVKRGKHVLQVVSVDAVGNVDATPATYRWKVRKKR